MTTHFASVVACLCLFLSAGNADPLSDECSASGACSSDESLLLQSKLAIDTSAASITTTSCDEAFGGQHGVGYRGCQTKTISGKTCQKWTSQSPHSHSRTPENYPNKGFGDHNYCRNPDGEHAIWCYTTDPDARWQYCNPLPNPGTGKYCVRATTCSTPSWCEGDLDLKVDAGNGYTHEATGWHPRSSLVVDKCFSSPVRGIQIHAPTHDAWAGSITYSSDGGQTFSAKSFPPYECKNCTLKGEGTSKIGVDVTGDDGTWGDIAACLGSDTCEIVDTTPPTPTKPCNEMCAGFAADMGWSMLCHATITEMSSAPPCDGCPECSSLD